MSWISRKKTPFNVWLQKLVVPIVRPFRFARIGMLDFSPIVALLVIDFAGTALVRFISKFLEI
jgi:uncharacterized protein YggT (Ycf19 family)